MPTIVHIASREQTVAAHADRLLKVVIRGGRASDPSSGIYKNGGS